MPAMPQRRSELPVMSFPGWREWEAWLDQNHGESPGVWLRIAKVGSRQPSVTYPEALETALRYGWIDGQKKRLDDTSWLQKFTPRGPRSVWSKRNRAKAEALMADGRMRPAGASAVALAKADGRWAAAYDSPSGAAVPDDFQAELEAHPSAREFFATLNSANRYAILWRIQTAKRAETRAQRIRKFVDMLERQEKLYP